VDKNGQSKTLKGVRHSVGYRSSNENFVFEEHEFSFDAVHRIYLTTDGLLDQNGGPKDIPYGKKRLVSHIETNHQKPIDAIKELVMDDLVQWQGAIDRNDDICFVGIEI
jgi:serine phosphatase RsbU (regulator of sigma subunit)